MGVARIFHLETPFTEDELFDIGYEQTADKMYLSHLDHDTQELRRYGHDNWSIDDAVYGTTTSVVTGVGATVTDDPAADGYVAVDHQYAVTAIDDTTGQQGVVSASSPVVSTDLEIKGDYVTVDWDARANTTRFNIYKVKDGLYGYIGSADGAETTFIDDNITPDFSISPPLNRQPFADDGDKPAVVTFHEQRLIEARTYNKPNGVFGSVSGDFLNMDYSTPAVASDAFSFGIVAKQVNAIMHIVSLKDVLLAFTTGAVFSIKGTDGFLSAAQAPIIRTESYRGANRVRPVTIDDAVFFVTAKKNASIRTIGYQFDRDGYRGNDITVFAKHFFRRRRIIDMAWAESPMEVLWVVRDDGKLLALTWQAEQEVWGWTLCETDGLVENVSVINEDGEDVAYFVVTRVVDGVTRRFIERLATPDWEEIEDAVYLDAAAVYADDDVSVNAVFVGNRFTGVALTALADGFVVNDLTADADGFVRLPKAYNKITVGRPYESWGQTLPIVDNVQGLGSTSAKRQRMTRAILTVSETRGLEVGPGRRMVDGEADISDNAMSATAYAAKARSTEPYGQPPRLRTDDLKFDIPPGTWEEATIVFRQRDPLPFTITGITVDREFGDD